MFIEQLRLALKTWHLVTTPVRTIDVEMCCTQIDSTILAFCSAGSRH